MRVGRNPALKVKRTHQHARVTVTTIVYIPFLSGYFEQSLDVLRLCLASIQAHTEQPFELFVFDNGSCEEVRSYLSSELAEGKIDYLFLSKTNLGKAGAWNMLFNAVPGEICVYCDSDIFFKPGWLPEHLKIMEAFPNVGMVTGLPIRQQVDVFTRGGLLKAEKNPDISTVRGHFISTEAMAAYCVGVSRDFDAYKESIAKMEDIRLCTNNVRALLGACHFQFAATTLVLRSMLPFEASLLLDGSKHGQGSESEFDQKIEGLELLRLSTENVYVHHLGNTLTAAWREWLEKLELERSAGTRSVSTASWLQQVAQKRYVKAVLMRLYSFIFRLYNTPEAAQKGRT